MKPFTISIFDDDDRTLKVQQNSPVMRDREVAKLYALVVAGRAGQVLAQVAAVGGDVAGLAPTRENATASVVRECRRRLRAELISGRYDGITDPAMLASIVLHVSAYSTADGKHRYLFEGVPHAPNIVTAEDVAEALSDG